jgi:hypothetical protein
MLIKYHRPRFPNQGQPLIRPAFAAVHQRHGLLHADGQAAHHLDGLLDHGRAFLRGGVGISSSRPRAICSTDDNFSRRTDNSCFRCLLNIAVFQRGQDFD